MRNQSAADTHYADEISKKICLISNKANWKSIRSPRDTTRNWKGCDPTGPSSSRFFPSPARRVRLPNCVVLSARFKVSTRTTTTIRISKKRQTIKTMTKSLCSRQGHPSLLWPDSSQRPAATSERSSDLISVTGRSVEYYIAKLPIFVCQIICYSYTSWLPPPVQIYWDIFLDIWKKNEKYYPIRSSRCWEGQVDWILFITVNALISLFMLWYFYLFILQLSFRVRRHLVIDLSRTRLSVYCHILPCYDWTGRSDMVFTIFLYSILRAQV